MAWIALLASTPEPTLAASALNPSPSAPPTTPTAADGAVHTLELAQWALQFTPHVTCVCEALGTRSRQAVLMDAKASLRLWGGLPRLLERLRSEGAQIGLARLATGSTGLVALARLFSNTAVRRADDLPLDSLFAAWPHLDTLQQIGCSTWGQLIAMPRGGITRRFGAELLSALDVAYGRRPETHLWLLPAEVFDVRHELPAHVENASGLLFVAARQLKLLQAWLRARRQGVLACRFIWQMDKRRNTPEQGELMLYTAQATQDMGHLERLLREHLQHTTLAAPAQALQLQSLRCEVFVEQTFSLLPEERRKGEPLHCLVERVASKLGTEAIRRAVLRADHRPEATQHWLSAADAARAQPASAMAAPPFAVAPALRPAWLMAQPLPLLVRQEKPHYHGPLQLLQGPERLEASCLVDARPGADAAPPAVARDYFIAWNTHAGLLWIFRERLVAQPGWYLHGLFG